MQFVVAVVPGRINANPSPIVLDFFLAVSSKEISPSDKSSSLCRGHLHDPTGTPALVTVYGEIISFWLLFFDTFHDFDNWEHTTLVFASKNFEHARLENLGIDWVTVPIFWSVLKAVFAEHLPYVFKGLCCGLAQ